MSTVTNPRATPVRIAIRAFARALVPTLVFSFFINLSALAGSIYSMQVYDRVLSSRNEMTLLFLTLVLAGVYVAYAALEFARSRVLVRAGNRFDEILAADTFDAALRATLLQRNTTPAMALRDMNTVREFWTGAGFITLCDAPWFPIFLFLCFLLHPLMGLVALIGAAILIALTFATEFAVREPLTESGKAGNENSNFVNATFRNAEVILALGMQRDLRRRWLERHEEMIGWQSRASDRAGIIIAAGKFVRLFLQSAIMAVGAWLAIEREISPGAMMAASIMVGRALAPVEGAVSQWKGFKTARESLARLNNLFDRLPAEPERMTLPEPRGAIAVESLVAGAPGSRAMILKNVSFSLGEGETLAIVGPSAAGKSTLARILVGVWPTAGGAVRLDGSELRHWDPVQLGSHIGYLPQDVELFAGTIAENIARFGEVDEKAVIEAAQLAGVHGMIQQLPEGYNTQIGEGGAVLSGGQRQRVGLARAVYGDPAMIVLDEPNSNLDGAGEEALAEALKRLATRGKTVIVVSHKVNLLGLVDKILVLEQGFVRMFGPRDKVLTQVMGAPRAVQGGPPQPGFQPVGMAQPMQPGMMPQGAGPAGAIPNGGMQPAPVMVVNAAPAAVTPQGTAIGRVPVVKMPASEVAGFRRAERG